MPSLSELPTELRQQILLLALPETNRVESAIPFQYIHLFHINRRLRADMGAIAPIWAPIHFISHPTSLTSCRPRTRGWNCNSICLDVFYNAFLGRFANKFGNVYSHRTIPIGHPELIEDWINAVPFLPVDVREIYVDVTPAPIDKREHHPKWPECGPPWLDLFLSLDKTARWVLDSHVTDVAALIRTLDQRYGGRARIRLCGRLSEKSRGFVEALRREVGRGMQFVGTWVENRDAFKAYVSSEFDCPMIRREGRCGTHKMPFAWLAGVEWSREAGNVYTALADVHTLVDCRESLKDIARFCDSKDECVVLSAPRGRGSVPHISDLIRMFQHHVAADLRLKTVDVGEGEGRHVEVWR